MRRMVIGVVAAAALSLATTPGVGRAGRRRLQAGAQLADAAAGHVVRAARGAARRRPSARRRRRRAGPAAAPCPGPAAPPTNQPGISGLAIDQHDRIYVFNRGPKPVMVFDMAGKLVLAGADQEMNGKKINPDWQHSGGVDWEGNV